MTLKRDENSITVGGAVTDDAYQNVEPLRTDPVTKRMIVDILFVASIPTPPVRTLAVRDANGETAGIAVTDDASKTISPLIVDPTNKRLICDVVIG